MNKDDITSLILIGKLGIGDWGLGIVPNHQSPIPNPHIYIYIYINLNLFSS